MAFEKAIDKNILFVAKLIELTQDGKLQWQPITPRDSLKNVADLVYLSTSRYDNKLLYLYRDKSFLSAEIKTISVYSSSRRSVPEFEGEPILEIVNENYKALWTFSRISGLSDLYEAVQYQASGVNNVIDLILRTDKNS